MVASKRVAKRICGDVNRTQIKRSARNMANQKIGTIDLFNAYIVLFGQTYADLIAIMGVVPKILFVFEDDVLGQLV